MPEAFAQADLVICRSGAGTVSELAAAGRASILVPFPFAADDHQTHNAAAMQRGGAARLVRDADFSGEKLFQTVSELAAASAALEKMAAAARQFAKPDAAPTRRGYFRGGGWGISPQFRLTRDAVSRNNTVNKCFFAGSICISRGSGESA